MDGVENEHFVSSVDLVRCPDSRTWAIKSDRSLRLSFVLSVCQSVAVSRITHERVDGCRPNTVGAATGDPVEVIHFCYSSGSECKSRIVSRFP